MISIERLYSTILKVCHVLLTPAITHLQYSTCSNNCWVLIVYQVTIQNKCSKYRPPELLYACKHTIMDCHTPSKFPGQFRMVWQAWVEISSF